MKRRILALVLALLLCSAFAVNASADAYIPPSSSPYYDITTAHQENGTCSALNTFLSNFVEVNLQDYTESSDDSVAIAAVLKHLELNAASFSSDVKKQTMDDGSVYMRISTSIFDRRMERLFGKDIPASACPGYEDGKILVSADHFGGPIEVFASVYACNYYDLDLYQVYFDAYYVNQDFSGWYRTAHDNLPQSKITKLGSGVALVRYDGGETESSISTADFTLAEFSMDAQDIPCQGANLPYGYVPPATEAPTEETEPATQAPTQPVTKIPTKIEPTQPETTQPAPAETIQEKELEEENSPLEGFFSLRTLVIIIILVLLLTIAALVIILIIFRKRK